LKIKIPLKARFGTATTTLSKQNREQQSQKEQQKPDPGSRSVDGIITPRLEQNQQQQRR